MEHQYGLITRFPRCRDLKAGWHFTECESLSDLRNCVRSNRMRWRYPSMTAVRSDGATLTLGHDYDDAVLDPWRQDAIAALRNP